MTTITLARGIVKQSFHGHKYIILLHTFILFSELFDEEVSDMKTSKTQIDATLAWEMRAAVSCIM
jgi:hypothetical protein